MPSTFPDPITKLPRADIPLDGVTGYILQGANHQIVFMEFAKNLDVPAHAHEAQWGVALEGQVDLVIGGVEHTYRKGDHYFIPVGVEHSGRIHAGYAAMEFYDEPARYKEK